MPPFCGKNYGSLSENVIHKFPIGKFKSWIIQIASTVCQQNVNNLLIILIHSIILLIYLKMHAILWWHFCEKYTFRAGNIFNFIIPHNFTTKTAKKMLLIVCLELNIVHRFQICIMLFIAFCVMHVHYWPLFFIHFNA